MLQSSQARAFARAVLIVFLASSLGLGGSGGLLAADEVEEPTPTPTLTPSSTPPPTPPPNITSSPAPTAEPTPIATPTLSPPVYPVSVMVDNFPSARPQTGLAAADIVYEALAEGGITRFLAIYGSPDPGLVGPVRSARHYYVYWAAEYNAPLVHVMASDEGYAALVNTGLPDLDEHRGDPGFLRSPTRPMPFNAYTAPAQAREILADGGGLWPGSFGGFERGEPPRRQRGVRSTYLRVTYPIAEFASEWTYDRDQRRYLRSQAGAPHLDAASGERISATTVVVQLVPAWILEWLGGEAYVDMQLTGSGRAVFFRGGLGVEGSWQKQSLGNTTQYLGPDGEPFIFPPGPIWVQVLPTGELEGMLSYGPVSDQRPEPES